MDVLQIASDINIWQNGWLSIFLYQQFRNQLRLWPFIYLLLTNHYWKQSLDQFDKDNPGKQSHDPALSYNLAESHPFNQNIQSICALCSIQKCTMVHKPKLCLQLCFQCLFPYAWQDWSTRDYLAGFLFSLLWSEHAHFIVVHDTTSQSHTILFSIIHVVHGLYSQLDLEVSKVTKIGNISQFASYLPHCINLRWSEYDLERQPISFWLVQIAWLGNLVVESVTKCFNFQC